MPDRIRVRVDGRELELSNLEKVLYPAAGFTKGEVIDYYTRVAPVMLPHLRGRALTRIRYPDGVDGPSFFEKSAPAHTPDWVRRERLPSPGSASGRETVDYVVADDLPTLVWVANLAALELHTPQWRVGADPDLMVVDLDPGPPAGLRECCRVALMVRDRLAGDRVPAYPKTSGRKGMQLSSPLAAGQPAAQVRGYAQRIATELARAAPGLVTSTMARRLRGGRVFFDWDQNSEGKTTIAPYSLRAEPIPTVSTPLTWAEVEAAADGDVAAVRGFTAADVLARVERHGDLLAPVLDPGVRLPVG